MKGSLILAPVTKANPLRGGDAKPWISRIWGDCLVAEGDREVKRSPSPALACMAIAKWLVTAAVVVLVTAIAPMPFVAAQTAPPQSAGSVTVTARVDRKVECTGIDTTHVALRANTPWRFTAHTVDGMRTLIGEPTGDTPIRIEIPAGSVQFSVTMEP
jgi:hypothetical protein